MKICQVYNYIAPAKDSMGAQRVCEALTKSLVELGHDVVMLIDPRSRNTPAPVATEVPGDVDIIHFHQWEPGNIDYESYGKPYVISIHGGGTPEPESWHNATRGNPHILCVSKFISDHVGCPEYVWECTDPNDFYFRPVKRDYFLWIGGTDWGEQKGIFTTIRLAKKLRFKLKIAGTGQNKAMIEHIKSFCDDKIEYVGAVNGHEKADLFLRAKATILLTQLPDACPVVMAESLSSGVPVIGSIHGSVPEVITPEVGFIVNNDIEFVKALLKIDKIHPKVCREYAKKNLSHTVSATKHLIYYENMIKYGDVSGI